MCSGACMCLCVCAHTHTESRHHTSCQNNSLIYTHYLFYICAKCAYHLIEKMSFDVKLFVLIITFKNIVLVSYEFCGSARRSGHLHRNERTGPKALRQRLCPAYSDPKFDPQDCQYRKDDDELTGGDH